MAAGHGQPFLEKLVFCIAHMPDFIGKSGDSVAAKPAESPEAKSEKPDGNSQQQWRGKKDQCAEKQGGAEKWKTRSMIHGDLRLMNECFLYKGRRSTGEITLNGSDFFEKNYFSHRLRQASLNLWRSSSLIFIHFSRKKGDFLPCIGLAPGGRMRKPPNSNRDSNNNPMAWP